jgi:hypothetical protein
VVAIDLDPTDHRSDDLARAVPVQSIQAPVNRVGKVLQAPDDERQVPFDFGIGGQLLPFCLEVRQALPHAADTGLELAALDYPFGIAVDEPSDAPAQPGDLAIEAGQGVRVAPPFLHVREPTPVLGRHPLGILEDSPDLVPDGALEAIATH